MKPATYLYVGLGLLVASCIGAFGYKSWSPKSEMIDIGPLPEARLNRFLALGDYLSSRYDCYVEHSYSIDYENHGVAYDLIVAPLEALPVHIDQWKGVDRLLYDNGILVTGLSHFDPSSGVPDQYASPTILRRIGIEDVGAKLGAKAHLVTGTCDSGRFAFESYFKPTFSGGEDGAVYGIADGVRTLRSLDSLDNETIASAEHVLIFEDLVAGLKLGPESEILIVHGREVANIWSWLFANARWVIALTAMLVGFVIWHFAPRFGPLIPEGERGTRELREHFSASARFLVRNRMSSGLLKPIRGSIIDALRRHASAEATQAELIQLAANLSRLPEADVADALFSPEIPKGSLTKVAATLQKLRTVL